MNIGFQPDGNYFIFDNDGKTVRRDIESKNAAQMHIINRYHYTGVIVREDKGFNVRSNKPNS
jgi:hypothetical protein